VNVIVEDKDHPATRHLGDSFMMHDEIYTQRNWSRDKTHVLMHLDMDSVDKEKAKGYRDDLDVALAWCHSFGDGKVFYTALGHGMPTWSNEKFHQHLLGGILWAMGDAS
jgi:type 1 glutamine amidotransferase